MNLPIPEKFIICRNESWQSDGPREKSMFDRRASKQAAALERALAEALSRADAKGAIRLLGVALKKTSLRSQWLRVAAQHAAIWDQLPVLNLILELGLDLPQTAGREKVDALIALGADDFQRWCGGDSRAGLAAPSLFAPTVLSWALAASALVVFRKDRQGMSVLACACLNESDSRPFVAAMAAGAEAVASGEASREKWLDLMAEAAVLMAQKNMPPDLAMGRLSAMDEQGLDWRRAIDGDGLSVFGASVIGVENEGLALALLSAGASPSSSCPDSPRNKSISQTAIGVLFNQGDLIWAYKSNLGKACLNRLEDNELAMIVAEGVVPAPNAEANSSSLGYSGLYRKTFEQELFGRLASIDEKRALDESSRKPSATPPKRRAI